MKTVIQRVIQAQVEIDNQIVGQVNQGFLILLGITDTDNNETVEKMATKILNLRIFADENDLMNKSVQDIKGEILIVSQFTLYGDCKKGNRPSFIKAARPEIAIPLYDYFIEVCKNSGLKIETGKFGAMMKVSLINDGPVTIILEM